jgi:hypothetical protein
MRGTRRGEFKLGDGGYGGVKFKLKTLVRTRLASHRINKAQEFTYKHIGAK